MDMVAAIVDLDEREWDVLIELKRDFRPEEICERAWERRAQRRPGFRSGVLRDRRVRSNARRVIGRFSTFLEHTKPVGRRASGWRASTVCFIGRSRRAGDRSRLARSAASRILTHCYWRDAGPELDNVNIMAVAHGENKEQVMAHKAAIDRFLVDSGIGLALHERLLGRPGGDQTERDLARGVPDMGARGGGCHELRLDERRLCANRRRTAMHDPTQIDFNTSPFVAIWETTRACDLACVHCRAAAQSRRIAVRARHRARDFGSSMRSPS